MHRCFFYFLLPLSCFCLLVNTYVAATSTPTILPPSSIYLDSAASWPMNEKALAEFLRIAKISGNSSGINSHSEYLRSLEKLSAQAIAAKIHCFEKNYDPLIDVKKIHFVSSATLANNIAILGVAYRNPGCHLITSKIEHKSVLNVFKALERRGYKVTYLDVDSCGRVNLKQLQKSICSRTKLVSIQMVNSEIGISQDIKAIGKIAKKHGILFHSDACQAFCKYPIDVDAMNIDLLTISGYKIGAPKGIAALYVRNSDTLQPIFFGSGDELFPGTKATPLICAFAEAVRTFSFNQKQIYRNYQILKSELLKIGEGIHINSAEPSHVLSVSISGVLLKDVLSRMKQFSFAAGCSCLGQDKSNVIEAIDPQGKLPGCTLRISFYDKTTIKTLKEFTKALGKVVKQLRQTKTIKKGCEQGVFPESKSQSGLNKSLDDVLRMLNGIEAQSR